MKQSARAGAGGGVDLDDPWVGRDGRPRDLPIDWWGKSAEDQPFNSCRAASLADQIEQLREQRDAPDLGQLDAYDPRMFLSRVTQAQQCEASEGQRVDQARARDSVVAQWPPAALLLNLGVQLR